ncbi:tyrosine-type recombinase/integrase [Chitinophaga sp. YIM B06452]|uniref:tyrosine-type recombinase/integrase n=1 Tax=Chitinophaga sp. YIM B06452 TaxID=3082158 RepID=UPI0031FF1967
MNELPPIAQGFLAYLELEKRYSPHTVQSYGLDLFQFFRYLSEQYGELPLTRLTHFHIQSWLAMGLEPKQPSGKNKKKQAEPVTPATIRRKMSALKSFFKYAIRKGELAQSPMAKVVSPKMRGRLPMFVDEKAMQQVEENHAEGEVLFGDDFDGATQRLIIALLYQSGIRRAELIGLTHRSMDLSNSQMKVLGKGNKERIIPLSRPLMAMIREYDERRRKEVGNAETGQLLVRANGKGVTKSFVYSTVRKALDKVTTISKRSPHILRHTFATHLMNNGADINAVKELLGHASLASTQVYTHNTIEKLKKVHQQAHPKA